MKLAKLGYKHPITGSSAGPAGAWWAFQACEDKVLCPSGLSSLSFDSSLSLMEGNGETPDSAGLDNLEAGPRLMEPALHEISHFSFPLNIDTQQWKGFYLQRWFPLSPLKTFSSCRLMLYTHLRAYATILP